MRSTYRAHPLRVFGASARSACAPWRSLLIGLALAVFVAGAARAAHPNQRDLDQLQKTLQGTFQSKSANEQWSIQWEEASLAVGNAVYYVRQSNLDNAQLLLAQRIWTFELQPKGDILQREWVFKDPQRWARVDRNPKMLLSMLPEDLRELPGCQLLWSRPVSPKNGRKSNPNSSPNGNLAAVAFVARAAGTCRPGEDLEDLWIERSATLSEQSLALSEQRVGRDGALESAAPLGLTLARVGGSTP